MRITGFLGKLRRAWVSLYRKQLAASLSSADLPRVFNQLPLPLAVITLEKDPRVLFINEQFTRAYGYTANDLRRISDWFIRAYPDPSYRTAVIAQWNAAVARAIADPDKVQSMEFRVTDFTGEEHEVMFNATVAEGRLVVSAVDVGAQRAAERAAASLQRALERTAFELTENIPVGTYTMVQPPGGGMGRFVFMSTRFLELTGLKRDEAEADPMKGFSCVHPDDLDEWVALNAEAFEQKKPFFGETRVVVGGKVRWISAESLPRTLADGSTVWEGVLTDITQRKDFEAALEKASAEARLASEAKTAFLANMSHEIRTPMNAVVGLSELLADEPLNEQQQDYVRRILNAAGILMTIIDDVLDMSAIESGNLPLECEPFSPNEVLDKVATLYLPLVNGRPVTVTVRAEPGIPARLRGDAKRLEQILGNMLSNAIKFTHEGEVSVLAEPLGYDGNQVRVRFCVRDTGIGIDQDVQSRLFQPFTQVHERGSGSYGGTGLGLSICKRLVELMGGEISMKSKLGKGSEFRVDLPFEVLEETEPHTAVSEQAHARDACPNLRRFNILIAEDDPTNSEILGELIAKLGGESHSVRNGVQVLAHLREHPNAYDAVLMDVQMPVMDGLSATRAIRDSLGLHALPVIAFTASVLETQREAALASGMNAVLSKPLRLEALSACLHACLPDKQAAISRASVDTTLETATRARRAASRLRHYRQFHDHYRDALSRLEQQLERGDKASARQLMQRLGAAARHMGASDLADAAMAIETLLEADNELTPEQLAELNEIRHRLLLTLEADQGDPG